MKTTPTLDRVVGTSRAHLLDVVLMSGAGIPLGRLPVTGGRLTGTARPGDRWTATLALAGTQWTPTSPTHPLAGFVGAWVRVRLGSVVDTTEVLLTAADLLVWQTTTSRTTDTQGLSVQLTGLAGYVAASAPRAYWPLPGETCQQMMTRLVRAHRPPGWSPAAVLDTSAPVPVPGDYRADGVDAWQAVTDLAAIANVTVFVDALQRLVIRPPLTSTPRPPARTLTAATDLTGWQVAVGRGDGFANRVELRCVPVQGAGPVADDVVGVAELTTGPLAVNGPAGRVIRTDRVLTGAISQAAADARAASLLQVAWRAWATTTLTCVPDPRLEPDDDLVVHYPGGLVAHHRIGQIDLPLDTGPMTITARTLDAPPETT